MSNIDPTRVITGIVRLSYVHLTQPHTTPGSTSGPRYGATILLPKSDIATKQRLDAAIAAATEIGVSKSWNGARPPVVPTPVYDGDGVRPSDGMPFGEECKGHWVFTASSKTQPEIVDAQVQPILSPSEIYSGMYARVSIGFFPYNNSGRKGIGCGLNNVQKTADGEPLSGRPSAADDFGAGAAQPQYVPPATPQYTPPAQPQYAAPAQYAPPQAPAYPQYPAQYAPQGAINPITGAPM